MARTTSLRRRVISGFSVLLVLFVAVGLTATLAIRQAGALFDTYRRTADSADQIANLQTSVLQVRLNINDFLMEGGQSNVDEYRSFLGDARNALGAARSLASEDARATLAQIDRQLIDLENSFDKVVSSQTARDSIMENSVNVLVPDLEDTLGEILRTADRDGDTAASYETALALEALLSSELSASRFLRTPDDAYRVAVEDALAQMETEFNILDSELQNPGRRALLQQAGELLSEYRPAVTRMIELEGERAAEVNDAIRPAGVQIVGLAAAARARAATELTSLGDRLQISMARVVAIVLVVSAIAALAAIVLAVGLSRGILGRLGIDPERLGNLASVLATGDLSADLPEAKRQDSVLASFRRIVDAQRADVIRLQEISSSTSDVAASLEATVDETQATTTEISANTASMSRQMETISSEVQHSADEVKRIASGINDLDVQLESQSSATEQATASVEEMIASLSSMEQTVDAKHERTVRFRDAAAQGEESAELVNQQMQEIVGLTDQVSEIIEAIGAITSQTDLLSMNAAIEAAHAGEAGRGFAVVAEEIRKLSEDSAENSRRIGQILSDIVERVREVGNLSAQNAGKFGEFVGEVTDVQSAFAEIAGTARELSAGSQEVLRAMENLRDTAISIKETGGGFRTAVDSLSSQFGNTSRAVDEVAGGMSEIETGNREIADAMTETAQLARQIREAADRLSEAVGRYRLERSAEAPEVPDTAASGATGELAAAGAEAD